LDFKEEAAKLERVWFKTPDFLIELLPVGFANPRGRKANLEKSIYSMSLVFARFTQSLRMDDQCLRRNFTLCLRNIYAMFTQGLRNTYTMFEQCLSNICAWFAQGLNIVYAIFVQCLSLVYALFAQCLRKICAQFAAHFAHAINYLCMVYTGLRKLSLRVKLYTRLEQSSICLRVITQSLHSIYS
jgi:hypothetical protein